MVEKNEVAKEKSTKMVVEIMGVMKMLVKGKKEKGEGKL